MTRLQVAQSIANENGWGRVTGLGSPMNINGHNMVRLDFASEPPDADGFVWLEGLLAYEILRHPEEKKRPAGGTVYTSALKAAG